jgi:hypothetical protein
MNMTAHTPKTPYDKQFFDAQQHASLASAKHIVPLLIQWIAPKRVVDVGCGVGTWLSVFQEHGVEEILGIDGDYVERTMLHIPETAFMSHDLGKPLTTPHRFDLVLSLEVAEHLSQHHATTFVESLVSLGDVIAFSAAVPWQGWGDGLHLNEQWPDYWVGLFRQNAYEPIDCIRPKIWANQHVCWWYAQNMLLFVKREHLMKYMHLHTSGTQVPPLSLVHPKLLAEYANTESLSIRRKCWILRRTAESILRDLSRKALGLPRTSRR